MTADPHLVSRAERDASAPHPATTTPLVDLAGISKRFGGVRALRDVSFSLLPGEVHALLGQNGAGKSTLIKILAGVEQKDSGTIRIDGRETEILSPAQAREAGIAVVYQDLSLVPSMSVADNLFLGREPTSRLRLVRSQLMAREAERFLDAHRFPLDPREIVANLPFAYRQLTEIAKALIGNVRILVLDEPTSALSGGEEEVLFEAMENVTRAGVGVIYVTHRLSEVFRVAKRVTVLRDGANVATLLTHETDLDTLVAAIVGKGLQENRLRAISGLGPHGERAARSEDLQLAREDSARASEAHYRFGIALHTTASDWSREQVSGIVSTLGRYGGAVIDTIDCEFDPVRQNKALEALIQKQPDAIISIPIGNTETAETHRAVSRAGIKLVLMDNAPTGLVPGEDYVSVVSADNLGLGEVAARLLSPHIPPSGIAGIVGYRADFFATSEREIGFRKWMSGRRPDVQIRQASFNEVGHAGLALDRLLARGERIDGLFVVWDEPAMHVVRGLKERGLSIPMTTIDLGDESAMELARGGVIKGIAAQQPFDQGVAEVMAALLALIGHEPPRWVALPAVAVTQQNVLEVYQATWHAPAPPALIKARELSRQATIAQEAPDGDGGTAAGVEPLVELVEASNDRLRAVSLRVAPGEVLGLAGMVGSGRTEILETIFGLRPIQRGELRLAGKRVTLNSPNDAVAIGIGLAPEDRIGQGLIIEHSIERNLALPRLRQLGRFGFFRRRASGERARAAMTELSVVASGPATRVGDLSGGNQQKVVFGKWRGPTPKVLLLDEPTAGVDVGAREQIYDLIRTAKRDGSAILVVSSELAELLLICDRIAFVVDGRVVKAIRRDQVNNEEHLHRLVQELQQ